MKDWQQKLYASRRWADCRNAYAKSKHYLCEMCLQEGKTTPSEIVHHRVPVTPENIDDPNITLNWSNLQCLCRLHHAQVHSKTPKRYIFDEMGRVKII